MSVTNIWAIIFFQIFQARAVQTADNTRKKTVILLRFNLLITCILEEVPANLFLEIFRQLTLFRWQFIQGCIQCCRIKMCAIMLKFSVVAISVFSRLVEVIKGIG